MLPGSRVSAPLVPHGGRGSWEQHGAAQECDLDSVSGRVFTLIQTIGGLDWAGRLVPVWAGVRIEVLVDLVVFFGPDCIRIGEHSVQRERCGFGADLDWTLKALSLGLPALVGGRQQPPPPPRPRQAGQRPGMRHQ